MNALEPNRLHERAKTLEEELLRDGYAHVERLLEPDECRAIEQLFAREELFRSRIVMERHGYGKGEYKYFAYPLPEPIAALRAQAYTVLAPIANRWNEALGKDERYPESVQQFLEFCIAHGQSRPTALLLRYRAGDYNCLHQDTYGEIAFPFQMTIFLSERLAYAGGEFVMVEQRPRRQSRPIVLRPQIGDAIVFPNRYRPVRRNHGMYRTAFKHGVSQVVGGERVTLGIIFHDAQ